MWVNPRRFNLVSWVTVAVMIGLTLALVGITVRGMHRARGEALSEVDDGAGGRTVNAAPSGRTYRHLITRVSNSARIVGDNHQCSSERLADSSSRTETLGARQNFSRAPKTSSARHLNTFKLLVARTR